MMAALKAATHAQHRDIERLIPLMNPNLTMAEYRQYLGRMLGYLQPIETLLESISGLSVVVPDLAQRRKSAWLRDDLGVTTVEECADLPSLTSISAALGCMYVLEGSTLGGQILARQIAIQLSEPRMSFLQSYGTDTGTKWKRFGAEVNGYAGDGAAMITAAQTTFDTLARWLSA